MVVAVQEPQPLVEVLDADVLLQPRAAKVGRPHMPDPDPDPEGGPRGQHGGRGLQQLMLLLLLLLQLL